MDVNVKVEEKKIKNPRQISYSKRWVGSAAHIIGVGSAALIIPKSTLLLNLNKEKSINQAHRLKCSNEIIEKSIWEFKVKVKG